MFRRFISRSYERLNPYYQIYGPPLREPGNPCKNQTKWLEADCLEEAFCCLESCHDVFVAGAGATPNVLLKAMTESGKSRKLKNVKVYHMHTEGPILYAQKDCKDVFRSVSLFMGHNVRKAVAEGRADCIPIFLSEIPLLFYMKIVKPEYALLNVSPPDKHGYCSFGTSVDCVRAATMYAKRIVAQVNERMPRTFGEALIHISNIDFAVKVCEELPQIKSAKLDKTALKIGKSIADQLVPDEATLQVGIGAIPDAVLASLGGHKNLGVHSEMFADGMIDLFEKGAVTNKCKTSHPGRMTVSFVLGTNKSYDFLHDNPFVEMLAVDYVNANDIIAKQHRMMAINSCVEIDLTGQVVSDSVGPRIISGFGGQVDFIRAAALSHDRRGTPIISMTSESKGRSKIVPFIKQGAGVVTTRGHIRYVVTEHGIANLFGKNVRQRAYELIRIAAPPYREELEKAAFERLKCKPSPD